MRFHWGVTSPNTLVLKLCAKSFWYTELVIPPPILVASCLTIVISKALSIANTCSANKWCKLLIKHAVGKY